jgi:hypothetical protein
LMLSSNFFFLLSLTVVAGAAFELSSDKQILAIWHHGGFSSCCFHPSDCLFSMSLSPSTLLASSDCCGGSIWTNACFRSISEWECAGGNGAYVASDVKCSYIPYTPQMYIGVRFQIFEIWPGGYICDPPPQMSNIPPSQRMLFWKNGNLLKCTPP